MIEKILERLEEEALQAEKDMGLSDAFAEAERCGGRWAAYEKAYKIVQEVAKEYDWISVTKKLPEEHKRALVELSNGWQVVATHDGEEWVLVWHYYLPIETRYVKVVRWKYLDMAYQKGE